MGSILSDQRIIKHRLTPSTAPAIAYAQTKKTLFNLKQSIEEIGEGSGQVKRIKQSLLRNPHDDLKKNRCGEAKP